MLRIHAAYHKCLTMYFIRVMEKSISKSLLRRRSRYFHYESIEGWFYNNAKQYRVASTNSFAIETNRLSEEYRITRFVRDPRDLVVSGYFYHKRGAEPWFRMKNPTNKYWEPINGNLPKNMPLGISYAEYLSGLSLEEGLMAEIEFRKHHLTSYRTWEENEFIKIFRYEDILGNEVETFKAIADHLQLNPIEKKKVIYFAKKYAYSPKKKDSHVRNPNPSQWKEHFTPKLETFFETEYSDILERYGYT